MFFTDNVKYVIYGDLYERIAYQPFIKIKCYCDQVLEQSSLKCYLFTLCSVPYSANIYKIQINKLARTQMTK